MKRLLPLICLLAAFITPAPAAEVYIVAGQSNGWRLSSLAELKSETSSARIHYFGMACSSRPTEASYKLINSLHPSTSGAGLAGALLEQANGEDIVFIQYCVCGTSLGDVANWFPGENPKGGLINNDGLYGSFTKYLEDARRQLEEKGVDWDLKGLFWHQGESDIQRDSRIHEHNFRNLVYRFRQDLGADLPIVVGHIRDLDDGSRGINRALDAVAAEDPKLETVELVDLPFESPTNVHVKPAGCISLGRQLVDSLIKLK